MKPETSTNYPGFLFECRLPCPLHSTVQSLLGEQRSAVENSVFPGNIHGCVLVIAVSVQYAQIFSDLYLCVLGSSAEVDVEVVESFY